MFRTQPSSELMHKYESHAATDVTGFGLLGHAENLAKFQKKPVKFSIDTLPIIKGILEVANATKTKLLKGRTPETSGGLLICLPEGKAALFCEEFAAVEGHNAWIVGRVQDGENCAEIVENPRVVEVEPN